MKIFMVAFNKDGKLFTLCLTFVDQTRVCLENILGKIICPAKLIGFH